MGRIGRQRGFNARRIRNFPPRLFNHIHLIAQRARRVDEQMRELSKTHRQQPRTGIHRVHQRGFPHRAAGGRKDKRLTVGLVDHLRESRENRSRERRKGRRAMILHRPVHRAL